MTFPHLDLKEKLSEALGEPIYLRSVTGGDIHQAFQWKSKQGDFFIKVSTGPGQALFEAEKLGLETLRRHSSFRIPSVVLISHTAHSSALALEWIESGQPGPRAWEVFGEKLAELHNTPIETDLIGGNPGLVFGLNYPNFLGRLPQQNTPTDSWLKFWNRNRFQPLLQMAINQKKLHLEEATELKEIPQLVEAKLGGHSFKPSLLHGDLWNGNLLFDTQGEPVIFDPAIYVGYAEMELAFMDLFGGFSPDYGSTYFKLYKGDRLGRAHWSLWQLYPLMAHLIMFGRSYAPRVLQTARQVRQAMS